MKVKNIDTETEEGFIEYRNLLLPDSKLFQAIEKIWWDWFEDYKQYNSEIEDMYFSDEAIYVKKQAIQGGIEHVFEVMRENDLGFIYLDNSLLEWHDIFS